MITAEASTYKSHLHVVYVFPDTRKLEIDILGTDPDLLYSQANTRLYLEIRKYILAKLGGFMRQRLYAFKLTDRAKMSQEAAKLIVFLGYYENRACHDLCTLVANNRAAIEALAPSERSAHYSSYTNRIVPILDFCDKMKGGHQ